MFILSGQTEVVNIIFYSLCLRNLRHRDKASLCHGLAMVIKKTFFKLYLRFLMYSYA